MSDKPKCMFFVYPPVGGTERFTFSEKGLGEAQAFAQRAARHTGTKVRVDVNCAQGAISPMMVCSSEGCTVPGARAGSERTRGISIAGVKGKTRRKRARRKR